MRNLKKLLAVIVSICVLATFTVPAFAADATLAADTQTCANIGVIVGSGSGVTAEYAATAPTRIQAAVMLLNLTGNIEAAKAFTGEDNFADADTASWAKPLMAFLKAHPELGFVGDGTNFAPNELTTAQQYYKVLLTALGYAIPGDYAYADTLTFAKDTVKLAMVGDVADFTIDSLATATVEALKATVKGGTKTLAATLVDAGKLDKTAAQTAGLYYIPKALDVDSAAAVTNTRVDVSLNTAAVQADLDAVTITAKDADAKALEVKSATLSTDGKTVKVVTAAQTVNVLYTLTIAGTDYKFVGVAVDDTKPTVTSAVATKNTKVKVDFSEDVDENALNIANYAIEGLAVLKAAYDTDVKDVIVLTTASQAQGTIYKVTVTNVTDIAGNVVNADYDDFQFGGLPVDETKPTLLTAVAKSNIKVEVTFDEEMDEAKAENIANYAIEGLPVLTATLDDTAKIVTLTTAVQTQGTIYKVIVTNVTDETGNVINADYDEFQFGGLPADETKPTVVSAFATANNKVDVTFDEEMDEAKAENIANYAIEGLAVSAATLDDTAKIVTLTTAAQTQGTIYKVVVTNVTDETGNVIDADYDEFQFGGIAADTDKPTVAGATSLSNTTVQVQFSENVDSATATKPYNYYLGSELGYPTKVVKAADPNDDGNYWVLTTKAQANKVYTVDVTGVKDASGNVLNEDSDTATFAGTPGDPDATAPKVSSAVAINKNTLKVTFNEALDDTTVATTDFAFSVQSGAETAEVVNRIAGTTASGLKVSDDGLTVTLQFNNEYMTSGVVYKVTVTGVNDANGVAIAADANNTAPFAGTAAANADPKVSSAVLINNQTLKIIFNEAVSAGTLVGSDFTITPGSGAPTFTPDFNKAVLASDAKSVTVYYKGTADANKFAAGKLYTVTVNVANFNDELGVVALASTDSANVGTFAGVSSSVIAPKISAIVAVDMNTIDIVFNQKITSTLGTGDIAVAYNGSAFLAVATLVRAEGDDGNKLRVFFNNSLAFDAGHVYKVTLDDTKIVNENGTAMVDGTDYSSFAAVSTANAAPKLASATATSTTTVKVVFSEKVTGTIDVADFAIAGIDITGVAADADGKTFVLTVDDADMTTSVYTLSVATGSDIKDEAVVGAVDTATTVKFAGK